MKKILLLFLSLSLVTNILSQKIITDVNDSVFINAVLGEHNFYRKQVKVPPLQWSAALAKEAAAYAIILAKTNSFKHSSNRANVGENLWMGTKDAYSLKEMLSSWTEEQQDFIYAPFPDCSKNGNVVGHYTQVIWKTTTHVGCAIVTNDTNDYLVCRYAPAGNWIGQKPY
jgi:uncharacterized protein YkwD